MLIVYSGNILRTIWRVNIVIYTDQLGWLFTLPHGRGGRNFLRVDNRGGELKMSRDAHKYPPRRYFPRRVAVISKITADPPDRVTVVQVRYNLVNVANSVSLHVNS